MKNHRDDKYPASGEQRHLLRKEGKLDFITELADKQTKDKMNLPRWHLVLMLSSWNNVRGFP